MRIVQLLPTLLLAVLVAGCATLPAQEMSDARQAIQAAEVAGATERAPRALNHARALLEQAQIELADRDYASARNSANAAKEAAIQAREAADDMSHSLPVQPGVGSPPASLP